MGDPFELNIPVIPSVPTEIEPVTIEEAANNARAEADRYARLAEETAAKANVEINPDVAVWLKKEAEAYAKAAEAAKKLAEAYAR